VGADYSQQVSKKPHARHRDPIQRGPGGVFRLMPTRSVSADQLGLSREIQALAAEPKLLVMDEPSAGLSPLFVKEVIRILGDLRQRGLALLIAEQNIGFLEVATRVFVLEGGRIRFSGTVAEMTDNEALRRAYFGLK